jgi:CHAT domain
LANAFFFAGARAVAVTQWAVFSSAAQQLGAGLVSRSVKSSAVGVSEGLRQAMVDYILSAKEDYLANPRFWGPFIIAGDGAVRPLDGASVDTFVDDPIILEWERLMPSSADAAFSSITKTRRDESFFSAGMEKPPPNEKRAGSYFARISSGGTVTVIDRDHDLAGSSAVSLENEIGILGFIPANVKSSAVFRLLSTDGKRRWQHIEDSSLWNFPVSMIKTSMGYILVSIEDDLSHFLSPSTLIFTLVSDLGATLKQHRVASSIRAISFSPKHVVLNASGNLVVAIGGNFPASSTAQGPTMWTNPITGTKRYCIHGRKVSAILEIDPQSLEVRAQKVVPDVAVESVKLNDGHLFAAGSFSVECRLETRIRYAELTPGLDLKTIYESNNVNSLEVQDLEITSDGTVLLGGVTRTFLPTALTVAIMTLEQLNDDKIHNIWEESFWETTEQHAAAFVLALSKDGTVLGDRVFPDLRSRNISTLAAESSDRFLAVGGAFGDRGWAAGLKLGSHLRQAVPLPTDAAVPLTQH